MTWTVLVTGGAGFIGTHTVKYLLQKGYQVKVLDNERTGNIERMHQYIGTPSGLKTVRGDIRDRETVEAFMKGCDFVIHLAAQVSVVESMDKPHETADINVTGTTNVLEAAYRAGVKRFVFASSCAVYGDAGEPPFRETAAVLPTSMYGLTKQMGEALCELYQRMKGLDTVILRFFNVYGPLQSPDSQYASVIPSFLKAIYRGQNLTIYGTGEQTRDFIYVGDLVRILETMLHHDRAGGLVINVGTGRPLSILELADRMKVVTGRNTGIRHAPPRPGEMLHAHAAITRLKEVLGDTLAFTEMGEGLAATWQWFRTAWAPRHSVEA